MKSVLIVTPLFPNRPGDRQGNFVYDSALALARKNMSVSVLVSRPYVPRALEPLRSRWMSGRLDSNAFPLLNTVRCARHFSIPRNYAWRLNEWQHDRVVEPLLERMADVHGADLIHAHTESVGRPAVRIARRLGIPVVVTLHGVNAGRRYFDNVHRRARFAAALNAMNRVILVGAPIWPFYAGLVGRDEHFRIVHNGVDVPVRRPVKNFDDPVLRLVAVANLCDGKGIDIALNALALARASGFENWTYVIAGDGPERAKWRSLSHALGLGDKVTFAGMMPPDQVKELLSHAHILLLPSYKEAFGIAYLEAMAAGALAIGVEGQGPAAFIEDNVSGLLVPPHDAESLAARLISIAGARQRMAAMAIAGAERVKASFNWDVHGSRLMDVYREIAAS